MIPTCDNVSGAPAGAPVCGGGSVPSLDMSSYTVYEWMESELGLGLSNPLDAKIYSMIYQASMHHRGYFQINQTAFCKEVGVSRKTLNRIMRDFLDRGLVLSARASTEGFNGGGAIKAPTAYIAAQGPINAAVVAVMDAKRVKAAMEWAKRDPAAPAPDYLGFPFSGVSGVINNPQVDPMSKKVTTDDTCGNSAPPNRSTMAVENSVVTEGYNGATCGVINNPQVDPMSKKVTTDDTCGNSEEPQVDPMSKKVTTDGKKGYNGATYGNAEGDTRLLEPSTCGSNNKTAGRDFERPIYIEERGRRKEDMQVRETCNNDALESKPFMFLGGDLRSLTPSEHAALSAFLAHWPKSTGDDHSFEQTAHAYARCLDAGYSFEQIQAAGEAYLKDFMASHDIKGDPAQRRYIMFPKSFLSRPDGLAKWNLLAPDASAPHAPTASTRELQVEVKRIGGPEGIWAYRDELGSWSPLPSSRSADEEEARRLAREQIEFGASFGKRTREEGAA